MGYQSQIKKQYEKLGYKVIKLIRLSESGYPDLMALKDGQTIFIECKEERDNLKPLQKFRIDELINLGFKAGAMQKGKGLIYGNL